MNEIDTKEFQEWYALMKERVAHIINDGSLSDEQKKVFMERSIEPLGTRRLSRLKNGNIIKENQNVPASKKQLNDSSLSMIIDKYKPVKDEQGIKIGPYIEDWIGCVRDLKMEGYYWNKDSKHFIKSDL